jgi:hypothetical protein
MAHSLILVMLSQCSPPHGEKLVGEFSPETAQNL